MEHDEEGRVEGGADAKTDGEEGDVRPAQFLLSSYRDAAAAFLDQLERLDRSDHRFAAQSGHQELSRLLGLEVANVEMFVRQQRQQTSISTFFRLLRED